MGESDTVETTEVIWDAIQVLDYFYKANQKRDESDQIAYKEFNNEALNRDINMQDQYADWIEQKL